MGVTLTPCSLSPYRLTPPFAPYLIVLVQSIGVPVIIKPKDITNGDKNLNLAFVAEIFNTRTGLEEVSEAEQKSLADLLGDEDDATSREERVFRQWINSLHIDDMHIENVFDDLNNGLNLLKAIDAVEPGTVKWKKVNKKVPMMKFKKGENCQYAVKLGKDLGFSLVGIGGTNIMDGDKKPILGEGGANTHTCGWPVSPRPRPRPIGSSKLHHVLTHSCILLRLACSLPVAAHALPPAEDAARAGWRHQDRRPRHCGLGQRNRRHHWQLGDHQEHEGQEAQGWPLPAAPRRRH